MSFYASILIATTSMHSMAYDYPIEEAFLAFEEACDVSVQLDGIEKRLSTFGWTRKPPETGSVMAHYPDYIMKTAPQLLAQDGAVTSDPITLERSFGGQKLHLMLLPTKIDGGYIIGCRMLDFAAVKPENIDDLLSLNSQVPKRKIDSDGVMMVEWEGNPEIGEGDTQILYLASDHEAAQISGASGLSFKRIHFGADEK